MMGFIAAVTHCSYKSNPRTLRGVETNPCCWGAERRAVIDAGRVVGGRDGAQEAVDVGYVLKAAVDWGLHAGRVAGDAAWWQWGGGRVGGMRRWRVRYAGKSVVVGGRAAPPGTAPWGYGPPFTPFESLRTGFDFPQGERTLGPRAALPLGVSALAGMPREGEGGRSPILTFPPRGKGYPATLPLWVPAFAGTTMGGGLERRLTETPPRRAPALDTGFRRYDRGV